MRKAANASPGDAGRSTVRLPVFMLATLIVIGIVAPFVAPYAPDAVDLANRRAAPTLAHWFGTDELGRDVLTRIAVGARVSLAIGVGAALMSVSVGACIGMLAGYFGRAVDDVLMRLTDALLAVPRLPLLMVASAVLHPGVPTLIVLVALTGWMESARVVRADVLSLKAREFVHAAHAMGATPARVMRRHLLPAVLPTVTVATTLAVGRSILLESTLSFFGVGVQPPAASWGNMLYQAQSTLSSEPWLAIFPGLFIFLTVLTCNLGGESLAQSPSSSPSR